MDLGGWVSIAVGVVLLIGNILAALEQIGKFLRWLVRPMCRWWHKRSASWPMKITLQGIKFNENSPIPQPNIEIELLVEPRKSIVVGRCLLLTGNSEYEPLTNIPSMTSYQEWEIERRLRDPMTFILQFRVVNPKSNDKVQIQVQSEGCFCKSNIVAIP